MLASMSWKQFLEWEAFCELDPFDEDRDDIRTASIVAAIYNVNRKKGRRALRIQDVLLLFGDAAKVRAQTWQQQKAYGMMYAKMFGTAEKAKKVSTMVEVKRG
jgi:hypothetical protein